MIRSRRRATQPGNALTQVKIALFTVAVTGFYTYVGAIVPQMEGHPPKTTEIGADLGPAELADAGRAIFFGKGTCALCHTIGETGQRCPDLAGVGARAASRKEGLDDVEYLAESLYNPNAYIVDGYTPTMPPVNRPPIGLAAPEIAAVIAFLQSQGGQITVTPTSTFEAAGAPPAPPPVPAGGEGDGPLAPEAIIAKYGCKACHVFDGPQRLLGPSLHDVGARQDPAAILQSIVDPDAVIAQGDPPYPPGLMAATLTPSGFYDDLSLGELRALANYLSGLRGGAE